MDKRFAVIGGGPVGLYSALLLAKKGNVTIYEKGSWPKDKVCGQGIMPSGVSLLKAQGIELNADNSYAFKGIKYIDKENILTGHFSKKPLGVKRTHLSQELYQKCLATKNISLKENVKINSMEQLSNYDHIYACDGLHSTIRRLLNLDKHRTKNLRMGARFHVKQSPWSEFVEVYWNKSIEAYVTPVSRDTIEIAFLWYQDQISSGANLHKRLKEFFPDLFSKINNNKIEQDFKAYGPFNSYSSVITQNNVTFLGDAYYFLDGITGEGISLGLKSANIMLSENPYILRVIRVKLLYLNYILWVKLALSLSRYPWLRRVLIKLFSKYEKGFNTVLKLNDLSF